MAEIEKELEKKKSSKEVKKKHMNMTFLHEDFSLADKQTYLKENDDDHNDEDDDGINIHKCVCACIWLVASRLLLTT